MKQIFQIRLTISILIMLLVNISSLSQTINYGLWYHQQPVSLNDDDVFFGGKDNHEGFCGLAASEMILQYFIPNIHTILFNKYGAADFHKDMRGGLKPYDIFCYDPTTTYTFQDFLGHNYIKRHIDKSGCSYREIETMFRLINKDIADYKFIFEWAEVENVKSYLDKGFLILMNTNQGGGHYILVGGYDVENDDESYYIWDSWKVPLDLDSTEFSFVNIAGNINNPGSCKLINTYKITHGALLRIFKDQPGNGKVPAIRIDPASSYQSHDKIKTCTLLIDASEIKNINDNVAGYWALNGVTDIIIPAADRFSNFNPVSIKNIILIAHHHSIKVHTLICPDEVLAKTIGSEKYNYLASEQIVGNLLQTGVDGITLEINEKTEPQTVVSINNYIKRKSANIQIGVMVNIQGSSSLNTILLKKNKQIYKSVSYIAVKMYTHDNYENPVWINNCIQTLRKNLPADCGLLPVFQTKDKSGNYLTIPELKQSIGFALKNHSKSVAYADFFPAEWQWKAIQSLR